MPAVSPPSFKNAVLNAANADVGTPADGPIRGAVVMLFQNDFTPDENTTFAEFTAATFDGYANSSAITWGSAGSDQNGDGQIVGDTKTFTKAAGTTDNIIYGAVILNAAADDWLRAFRFTTPVSMNTEGQNLDVIPRLGLS